MAEWDAVRKEIVSLYKEGWRVLHAYQTPANGIVL